MGVVKIYVRQKLSTTPWHRSICHLQEVLNYVIHDSMYSIDIMVSENIYEMGKGQPSIAQYTKL